MAKKAGVCILLYALAWTCSLSTLWEVHGTLYGRIPQWFIKYFFASFSFLPLGFTLGAISVFLTVTWEKQNRLTARQMLGMKSGLGAIVGLGVLAMFGMTVSGVVPAILAVISTLLAASILELIWKEPFLTAAIRIVKWLLITLSILTAILTFAASLAPGILLGLALAASGVSTDTESISPDGAYKAIIDHSDTGAIGSSDGVFIQPRYSIGGIFRDTVAGGGYMSLSKVQWKDSHTLIIYDDIDCDKQWHDVKIIPKQ